MRTSLNKIKAIDDYLSGEMTTGSSLVFEANMLLDKDLANDVQCQQVTYAIIRQYSRQRIKDEIITVQKIFTNSPQHRGFMRRIANLFTKH